MLTQEAVKSVCSKLRKHCKKPKSIGKRYELSFTQSCTWKSNTKSVTAKILLLFSFTVFLVVEILLQEGCRESKFAVQLTSSSELSGSRQYLLQSHEKFSSKGLVGFTDTSGISRLCLLFTLKFSTLIFSSYSDFVIFERISLRELLLTTCCSCTRYTTDKNTRIANKFLMVHLPTA